MKKAAQLSRAAFGVPKIWQSLPDRASADEVHDREQDDCADQRIEKRLDRDAVVERGAAAEQQAGDEGANDADDDVEDYPLLRIGSHDQACEPAANATDDQPDNEVHELCLLFA